MQTDNTPRFSPTRPGVESWFLRANDPHRPRAIWLKATVLTPTQGPAVAETWCATFNGTTRETTAHKATVPLDDAQLTGTEPHLHIGDCVFDMGVGAGAATGRIPSGDVHWDLTWRAPDLPLAQPVCVPPRGLIPARFPKNKLLTPTPVARTAGTLRVRGETWDLSGWTASQGHNWGAAHAPAYAWGQVVFPDSDGGPAVFAEGFSGRIAVGPLRSPWISALTVRRGAQELRFDRLLDRWRHRVHRDDLAWRLQLRGRDGRATFSLEADPALTVACDYHNPNGSVATCLNSKLARAVLRVQPLNDDTFEVRTDHGAALEFLSDRADPRFPNPV